MVNNSIGNRMKVGHVGINVNDIEVSKKFYKNVFDFEVIAERLEGDKKYLFLGLNGEIIITLWEQSKKKFSKDTAGLHHLAFQIDTVEQLINFEKKLDTLNVEKIYDKIVSHAEGTESGGIYFLDPDSVRLEVCVSKNIGKSQPDSNEDLSCGFF